MKKKSKIKNTLQICDIDQNFETFFLNQNSASQAACDTSIASVAGGVYPREGYGSLTLLLMPRSSGLETSNPVLRTETV